MNGQGSRKFILKSHYEPAGDQPAAISALVKGLGKGMQKQTLLGATGTGTYIFYSIWAE